MNAGDLVAEAVWKQIETTRTGLAGTLISFSSGIVTDEQLSILHFLFGKNVERAIRIVDRRGVRRIFGEPSGRCILQILFWVEGESQRKEEYFCFPEHYCACYSFFYDTVNRGDQLCCKHQLAARLASSMGECVEVRISDEELAVLLSKL